jgi:TonB family protein
VVSRAQPVVRGEALGSAATGTVTVRVALDSTGKVTAVRSTSGPSLLRDSAEDAARRSRFEPAVQNGASIASEVTVVYTFTRPANDVRQRGR